MIERSGLCLLLAAILLPVTISHREAARQCVVFDEPSEYFALSDVVFLGTVLANKSTGAVGDHVITEIATLKVERTWKGPRESQFVVGDGQPFTVEGRYVVFAGRGRSGDVLSTAQLCGWAELESKAKKKLAWLATKPSQRPQ